MQEKTGADAMAECGDCEFTVCAHLDLDDPNDPNDNQCVKSATDTVSHTCVWPDDQCPATAGTSTAEVVGVPDGNTQCQTGAAGQTLTFLFKDGGGCDDSGAHLMMPFLLSIYATCCLWACELL